jgi:acyl-homoserine-lactone acylase
MNPKNHLQYWFDDHWETLQVRKKTVKVKLGAIRIPITKTFYWSKYGTTIKNKDGYYSLRFPANMDIRACEQLYEMNKAKNFTEWRNIMRKGAFPGINFVYADREDNIYYVSNGQFPYRNPKYNWEKVLPGNTSETWWPPVFLPFDSLPQVLNPKSGYLVNTNNSPFEVTGEGDNVKPEHYSAANGFGMEGRNNRSIMAHYLISKQPKLTYEDFKRIKYDEQYNDSFYNHGLTNARVLFELDPRKYPDLADAIKVINEWNCSSDVNNQQAALITFAMYPLIDKITSRGTNYESNSFTEKEYAQALRQAKRHMLKHFGSLTVPLGQVQKHVRGNKVLPIGGMPEVLAATITEPYKKGMRKTFVGESYIQLVRYSKNGIELETVHAYGSSARPNSPHYNDQMELFVSKQLKPMTLNKEEIYHTAESVYHPGELNSDYSKLTGLK